MRARVPQDVDLEDRLVFGLTPIRFGYLVIAALAAFTVWSAKWAAAPVRVTASVPVLGLGAGMAWGTWRGQALDRWALDVAVYLYRNIRLGSATTGLRRSGRTHRPAAPPDAR